jgi:hypothetical protein
MKEGRQNQRRVTLRYRQDAVTGKVSLIIDVEVPEDEMPHEHRHDLKEMAEELLGMPLGSLPEGTAVNLKPQGARPAVSADADADADHDHDHDHGHEHPPAAAREATKQGS